MVFAALADPTRRQIFEALRHRALSVRDLASGRRVSRPAVSQHLKVLQQAGLVNVQPEGTRRIYSIRRDGLSELRRYLDALCAEGLSGGSESVRHRPVPQGDDAGESGP